MIIASKTYIHFLLNITNQQTHTDSAKLVISKNMIEELLI